MPLVSIPIEVPAGETRTLQVTLSIDLVGIINPGNEDPVPPDDGGDEK
jgi:hypothetical protein